MAGSSTLMKPMAALEDGLFDGLRSDGGDTARIGAAGEQLHDDDDGLEARARKFIREANSVATTWLESHIYQEWADNQRLYHSQHVSGSKYHDKTYEGRTRLFRPKSRAAMRRQEAAAASAFFSTRDVTKVRATDDSDEYQQENSKLLHRCMNYRLTHTIPWFKVLIGMVQDAGVQGVCATKVYWDYEEVVVDTRLEPVIDPLTGLQQLDETGAPMFEEYETVEVRRDRPWIDLIPPENVLIDPGASWLEPHFDSPYLILKYPMFREDVEARMRDGASKTGGEPWREIALPQGKTHAAGAGQGEQVRYARERQDSDKFDVNAIHGTTDIIWVHENFLRIDGEEMHCWSLEDKDLFTDVRPIEEVYHHGKRPVVLGYGNLEAHRVYPDSKIRINRDTQAALNDVQNLRLDMIKQNAAPQTILPTSAAHLRDQFTRRIPGRTVVMPEGDSVNYDRPPAPDAALFLEQDRLNLDYDELAGIFSGSSVASNRSLNETVGGLRMLGGDASNVQQYDLMVLAETAVRPTLMLLADCIRMYETDEVVLAVAAQQAKIRRMVSPDDLNVDVLVTVDVGNNATNPAVAMEELKKVFEMIGAIFGPVAAARADFEEIVTEIFGMAGYTDGARFFLDQEDPQYAVLTEQIKKLKQEIETNAIDNQADIKIAQIKADVDRLIAAMEIQAKERISRREEANKALANQQRYRVEEKKANRMGARPQGGANQ